jgi:hypothetical protein
VHHSLPKLLPGLSERQNSLVIRPHVNEKVTLIQLDDLDAASLERLKDAAFLTLCTSAGNHQAWVALPGPEDKDFARRLRKGAGADASASGATRVAGTVNYKRKYCPGFPTVSIVSAIPGRISTPERLDELGLVAAPQPVRAAPLRVSRMRSWPDYERYLQGAPINHGGTGPDVSRADFFYAMLAAQRGHGIEEIAAKLLELSPKAKENGEQYARLTAENATAACERARQRASETCR